MANMRKRWEVLPACPFDFAATVGVSDSLAQILWNRQIRTSAEVADFLESSWEKQVHDPTQFRDAPRAIERVFDALTKEEKITVHGDYDADGVTGSVVLMTTLREIEKHLRPNIPSFIDSYIPHRDKEGYGLRKDTIPKLVERETRLIITVDCGIACVEEIALAKTALMDTIVVDHHQFGEILPDGFLIHPGLPEETYPFKKLAAVGVAFKFASLLLTEARRRGLPIAEGWEKWLLDLVAIATVTDMVPLIGENRVLQIYGLRVLNKTRRPGLLALIRSAGLELGQIDTEGVGFGLGPRINAAGRMDHATLALRLLLSESEEEASLLAQELEGHNRERQNATKRMMAEAESRLGEFFDARFIVLWDKRWSPSLVGLAAGKIADRFGRPAIVIGEHDGTWIGSGRSIFGYDIAEATRVSGEGLLTRSGGHPQACGFSLDDEAKIAPFMERLQAHAMERLQEGDLIPRLEIDADLSLNVLDEAFVDTIEKLEPFGEGNRRPVFVSRQCPVVVMDVVGATGSHLRLTLLAPNSRRIKTIGFKMGDRLPEIKVGGTVDIVYHVDMNEWNGRREVQCKLIDLNVCVA